ncbi:MAG: family 16 glycoside hydrolase [Planctomycetota bacterium]|jgi:type 1 glutamine amidotransferase
MSKKMLSGTLMLLLAATSAGAAQWVDLFDGKTLSGWTIHSGFAKYEVQDGTILGTAVEGSPNSFLCTEKEYGDFILEFEVKCDPKLNSGVQIRSQIAEKETFFVFRGRNGEPATRRVPPDRVYGYQVEIASSPGNSGGIYDEARRAFFLAGVGDSPQAARALKNNEWNKYRIECKGSSIKTWINGIACADLKDSMDAKGTIGLQVHGVGRDFQPYEVRWRNIRIRELDPDEVIEKLKVVVITGGHGFEHDPFFEMFDAMKTIDNVEAVQKDHSELFEDISGWDYDVIVFYNMTQKISPKRRKNFVRLLGRGVGVVALHHTMGAYQEWPEFKKIIGTKYYLQDAVEDGVTHGKGSFKHDVDIRVHVANRNHPITRGIRDFTIHDETYKNCWFDEKNQVLLTTDHPTSDETIGWVRRFRKAKVCTIQLGHDSKAYADSNYSRLVERAILWTAGKL